MTKPTPSKTPRTDVEWNRACDLPEHERDVAMADFAGKLELELQQKDKELAELRAWALSAFLCLEQGVHLMDLDALSNWNGVRAIMESIPVSDKAFAALPEPKEGR